MSDEGMEKHGNVKTELPDGLEKSASGKPLCPDCGAECEQHGTVTICPNHGTKPFEKKP